MTTRPSRTNELDLGDLIVLYKGNDSDYRTISVPDFMDKVKDEISDTEFSSYYLRLDKDETLDLSDNKLSMWIKVLESSPSKALTVVLPSANWAKDGQEVLLNNLSSNPVSVFFGSAGASVIGGEVNVLPSLEARFKYDKTLKQWFRTKFAIGSVTTVVGKEGDVTAEDVSASLLTDTDLMSSFNLKTPSGLNQQSINDVVGAPWYVKTGGYAVGGSAKLSDGVIVVSTTAANTNNPNSNMIGWEIATKDKGVLTWSGRTQEFENKRMSKARLGQRVLHTNLSSSIDAGSHKYPQGGCKVGDSIFLKIGTNNGVVGEYTEEFIIAEYDFNTGAKIAETAPMITLGHHELNGFIKDGKTYLVTSYQPQVSSNNQSGAGASFIEWKGSATTLDNVTGYKLLNELEYIGYPAVDEKGEYLYIAHTYYGTATHDGFVTGVDINRAPVIRIHAYKVSELNPTYNNPLYTFQVECPAGDGNNLSNAINGFTATSDHVYLAFGAAYGNCEIHKYTTSGDIVERVVTYHARAARPFNEIVTPTLFLYNAEPEGCFVADGKMYLICAEDWYGLGEIVRYHGKYYMARYTMTGLSPASHTQNWVDLPYVPESFTEYSATTTYQGRNTSIGEFKRSIIEIGLKSPTLSYDLLGANGSNSVPNIINNMSDRVHIYGTLINGNAMTFGQYNPNRQSFQKNMTLTANELLIYDTRSPTKLNTKAAALQSYQQDTNNMTRLRASSTSTTWFDVYGVNHNIDNVPNIPYAYAARIMVDSKESVSFYKDGRLYNRSYNSNGVAAKFYTQESETLSLFQGVNATYIDTTNQYTWLGQVGGGVHGTATIGMNHSNKTVFPPTDGATELGTRELKWGRVATKDLILQPSTTLLPVNNGELVVEATSNTTITIKLKGTDGVTRSVALTLA